MTLLAHVDMDSFYVSVERERDPSLCGKPVVVAGRPPRGVVASASYEARKFGVRSAMPTAQARALCPDLVIVEPHGALYSQRSKAIFAVLAELSPVVEAVSIDEAYLDLTGTERLYGPPLEAGRRIREEILKRTGLSASVGLGSVRHIAKMASKRAKPGGVFWVESGTERGFLAPLPVRALPGLGPSAEQKLARMGITTLGELAARDEGELSRRLGSWGADYVRRARGEGETALSTEDEVKSVGKEITLDRDSRDVQMIEGIVLAQCEKVAARLRRRGLWARTVTLKLRDSSFKTWTRAHSEELPTQDEREIFARARTLLHREFEQERPLIRLIGVTCSQLSEQGAPTQQNLFGAAPRAGAADPAKRRSLDKAVDTLRQRYGFDAVRRAGALGASEGTQEVLTGKGALRTGLPTGFRGAVRDEDD